MANDTLEFRCADAGHKDCPWHATGSNEQELLDKVRQHGSEKHGISNWTEDVENKVRGLIHRRPAA